MFVNHPDRTLVICLMVAGLGIGCSKPAEAPAPAKEAAPQASAPAPDVKGHMDEHFTRVHEIEEAVIRGDLDGARAPAQWIADHQETAGLPEAAASHVAPMKDAAKAIAAAPDIATAAKSTAWLVGACGDCHAASNAKASLPTPAMPPEGKDKKTHMAEHQYAVDLLYRGLAVPSDDDWKKGAEALAGAPLGGKDLPEAKDSLAAEKKIHVLAAAAAKAADRPAKVTAYGEVIASCASCHGMHGRVWGPGVPKAE